MLKQSLQSQNENKHSIHALFPFLNLQDAIALLGCSKFFLYSLIGKNLVRPHYFFQKNGEGAGKPYFNIEELAAALTPENKGKNTSSKNK